MTDLSQFVCYTIDELKNIKVDGKNPQSMTEPYDCSKIVIPRFKDKLINQNEVFVISSTKKNPVHRFKEGQEIKVSGQYFFGGTTAECFGKTDYIHKGFRMTAYFFQMK